MSKPRLEICPAMLASYERAAHIVMRYSAYQQACRFADTWRWCEFENGRECRRLLVIGNVELATRHATLSLAASYRYNAAEYRAKRLRSQIEALLKERPQVGLAERTIETR